MCTKQGFYPKPDSCFLELDWHKDAGRTHRFSSQTIYKSLTEKINNMAWWQITINRYSSATKLSRWNLDIIHLCTQNGSNSIILWPSEYKRVKWYHKMTAHIYLMPQYEIQKLIFPGRKELTSVGSPEKLQPVCYVYSREWVKSKHFKHKMARNKLRNKSLYFRGDWIWNKTVQILSLIIKIRWRV